MFVASLNVWLPKHGVTANPLHGEVVCRARSD